MLIVFDMDGTLVDSCHNIIAAANEAFYLNNIEIPDEMLVRQGIGLSLEEAIIRLLPEGAEQVLIDSLVADYKTAFNKIRMHEEFSEHLFAGAEECIKELDKKGCLLGIATGKSYKGAMNTLTRHELQDYFITVNTPDNSAGKPHPGMLERAMNQTGSVKEETYMIGDTTFDMLMAKNAGTKGIGVSWGYHETDELQATGADFIINSFNELLTVLD